jgi:hypothetical protein
VIAVVACGKAKRDLQAGSLSRASELYTSTHFRFVLAAARCIQGVDRVLILSAKHGLLRLDDMVSGYDITFGDPGSITPSQLVHGLAFGCLEHSVGVFALLPQAYLRVLDDALGLVGVPGCINLFAGCRGIGDQRAVCARLLRRCS